MATDTAGASQAKRTQEDPQFSFLPAGNQLVEHLERVLQGQRQINGKLCQVDWRLLEAIRELRNAVGAISAQLAKSADESLSEVETSPLDLAIDRVWEFNQAVAGVDPPGCLPRDPTDPLG
jgi:hypothetical protein